MGSHKAAEQIRVALQRRTILGHVISGVSDRTALIDYVSDSRSTVYRALDELVENGLLTEQHGNYTPTSLGSLIYNEVTNLHENTDSLNQAEPLLDAINTDLLDIRLFSDASVCIPSRYSPDQPLRALSTHVDNSTKIKVLSPTLPSQFLSSMTTHLYDVMSELIVESEAISMHQSDLTTPQQTHPLIHATDVYTTDSQIPFGLFISNSPKQEVCVVVYNRGRLCGTIRNTTQCAYQWAKNAYQSYKKKSDSLSETTLEDAISTDTSVN
ncbi:hypothetical protein [Haloferax sp. KTX1]|uniref:transcriptional regulator FilR1 domain-containing protein n=1 Tax=Haloferax sp. KTX1 TaxID=2600597 RepID=UPI0011DDDB2D|nr:hypothetical protein [Haloferax sp. KTX1]